MGSSFLKKHIRDKCIMPLPENEKEIVLEALKKHCYKARWGYNKTNLEYYKELKKRKIADYSDK